MKTLGKITFASCGLGLTVLLAGGSMDDKSTPVKTLEAVTLMTPIPRITPEKAAPAETPESDTPNFATVFQTNNLTTETFNGNLAVSTGEMADERRQMMINRLQTIAR